MNPLPHFFRRNRLFFFNQLLGEKIKIWITGSKDIAIEQSMQNCVPNQFFYWYQSVYHWGLVRIDTPIALEDEQCVTISISCQNNILIGWTEHSSQKDFWQEAKNSMVLGWPLISRLLSGSGGWVDYCRFACHGKGTSDTVIGLKLVTGCSVWAVDAYSLHLLQLCYSGLCRFA